MLNALIVAPVIAAGIYLLGLGGAALTKPERARTFLSGFASSARAHVLELFIRLLVGAALVLSAPQMRFAGVFVIVGWVLVATTLGLLVVPWTLHHRFAGWSVPLATRNMRLLGIGSLAGGILLLAGVFLGPVAGR